MLIDEDFAIHALGFALYAVCMALVFYSRSRSESLTFKEFYKPYLAVLVIGLLVVGAEWAKVFFGFFALLGLAYCFVVEKIRKKNL